ncbi:Transcription factor MYB3R-4 [Hondaea fermentalgiana]|uniref:Transcription factor MYB3R-4 n=1 Tax=Hondaea fermentalgiana TaxID=2315210 RepID=A0A2R5G5V8_9STRA|nr:Transcription factor MYB3R-4 [Hondaea fermentalgiana]|eukprot:GBG25158.1 Transcription factor MYB3R-4 [Hondaea fermentalgiana]
MASGDPARDSALEDNTPSPTNVLKENNNASASHAPATKLKTMEAAPAHLSTAQDAKKHFDPVHHQNQQENTFTTAPVSEFQTKMEDDNGAAPIPPCVPYSADGDIANSRISQNLPVPSLSEIPPGPDENGEGMMSPSLASTTLVTPNPLTPMASFVTPAKPHTGAENQASSADNAQASIIVATGPVGEGGVRKRRAGRRWTAHEDSVLKALVEKNGQRHWKKCAREFQEISGSVRSDVQCLHRWNKCLRPGLVKGQWSSDEDAIIIQMIKENGGHHNVRWSVIAKKLKGRLGKQVRERWINHLDPSIVKKEWALAEDEKLYQLQRRFGNRWKWIAELMPGRSENGVKNRWHSIKPSMLARKDQESAEGTTVLSVPKNPNADPKAVEATARTMTAAAVNAAVNAIASKQNKNKRAAPRKGRSTPSRKRVKKDADASALSPSELPRVGTLADLLSIGQQFAAAADKNLATAAEGGSNMNLQEVAEKAKELLRMSESYREMARAMLGQQSKGKKPANPTSPQFNAHLQQEIANQISKHFGDLQHAAAVQDGKDDSAATSSKDPVLFSNYLDMFADTIKNSSPKRVETRYQRPAMRVLGIGVDLAHVPRFERSFARFGLRFTRKFLHANELASMERQAKLVSDATARARFLASRWAAKEAAFKAFGPSSPRLLFTDIEVAPAVSGGGPSLHLHGLAKTRALDKGVEEIFLSLSHDGEYAFAQVLLQGESCSR